jgi:hypothetical protein
VETVLASIRNIPAYQGLLNNLRMGQRPAALALPRAARLPFLATLAEDFKRPILLLTDRADHGLTLYDEFSFWYGSSLFIR